MDDVGDKDGRPTEERDEKWLNLTTWRVDVGKKVRDYPEIMNPQNKPTTGEEMEKHEIIT